MEMTMFWMPVGRPTRMMRPAMLRCSRMPESSTWQASSVFIKKRRLSTQETSWLRSVAMAAPATPIFSPAMSTRSSTMLVTDAAARYTSDRRELPAAFRMPAVMLYTTLNSTPPK